jgi:hypothetical protein
MEIGNGWIVLVLLCVGIVGAGVALIVAALTGDGARARNSRTRKSAS